MRQLTFSAYSVALLFLLCMVWIGGVSGEEIPGTFLYANQDTDPANGPLNLTWKGGFAFDCLNRSVGLDFGTRKKVTCIRLFSTRSLRFPNRVTRNLDKLSLWFSDDNVVWHKYEKPVELSATQLENGTVCVSFSGVLIESRYVKVHGDFPYPAVAPFEFEVSRAEDIIRAYYEELCLTLEFL